MGKYDKLKIRIYSNMRIWRSKGNIDRLSKELFFTTKIIKTTMPIFQSISKRLKFKQIKPGRFQITR